MFQVGLWGYYAGDYPRALRAFAHFRELFPSREVSHNLATSHHQLALQAYQTWKQDIPPLPFQLSLTIDPLTRASRILSGRAHAGRRGHAKGHREPLSPAPGGGDYPVSGGARARCGVYAGCPQPGGCTYRARSSAGARGLNADFAEAVWRLQEALQHTLNTPTILNSLGVALFYARQGDDATEHLVRARTLAPTYAAPALTSHNWRASHTETPRPNST